MKALLTASALLTLMTCSHAFGQEVEAKATPVGSSPSKMPAVPAMPSIPAANTSKMGPITISVDLVGGQKITGAIVDVATVPVRTAFGEASVPMGEVAGVRFASAEDASTTVIMKNGDSITGATDLKLLTVETEWGTAKINGSSITSILLIPDLKWQASIGLNGKRWSLVDAKSSPNMAGPLGSGNMNSSNPNGGNTSSLNPGTTVGGPMVPGALPSPRSLQRPQ